MTPCNTIGQGEAGLSDPDLGEPGHEQPGGNYTWVPSETVTTGSVNAFLAEAGGSSYVPGYWQWSPAVPTIAGESCGWNPACNFLDGFGNLFLAGGNRGKGVEQLVGSEAAGVAGFAGGSFAVGPISEFAGAAADYAADIGRTVYTSPELVEGLRQFVEGMDGPVATRWGAWGGVIGEAWDHRDWIQNQF